LELLKRAEEGEVVQEIETAVAKDDENKLTLSED
jgi:hypothetical protein